jgi:hypothetical protein
VNLSGTRVKGPGLVHLKHLKRLEELYLDDTPFSDDGLPYVAKLESLVFLSLKGTRVTDGGLHELDTMKRLKTVLLDRKQRPGPSRAPETPDTAFPGEDAPLPNERP